MACPMVQMLDKITYDPTEVPIITGAMIDAGAAELRLYDPAYDSPRDVVMAILRAVWANRPELPTPEPCAVESRVSR